MPQYKDQYESIRKFGRNSDIDTNTDPEDIWDGGGVYSFPASATTTTIVSDSTDDDGSPAGTGANTVQVYGLDSDYMAIDETVTLNGTSAVTLTNQYLRVFRAKVLTAGSGGVNAGNLQVKHGSTVLAQITAGYGQTLMSIYTVPADYTVAWLTKWSASVAKPSVSTTAIVALQMRAFGGAWQTKEVIGVSNATGVFAYEYVQWSEVAAKTDIRVRALEVSANDTDIAAQFELLLDR